MNSLGAIRDKVRERRYEFSKHAVDQSVLRRIRVVEVTAGSTFPLTLTSSWTKE